jgi:hypothetical protein
MLTLSFISVRHCVLPTPAPLTIVFPCTMFTPLTSTGEAAVGKSSLVLRFVSVSPRIQRPAELMG